MASGSTLKDREKKKTWISSDTKASPVLYGLKIMIMNTGGGSSKNKIDKPTEKRKQAIHDVVTHINAGLVLLQEFGWTDLRSKAWRGFEWPESFEYTGNNDASIIYDLNELMVEQYPQRLLDGTLQELIRLGKIPQGFTPFPRMCLRKFKTKGVPVIEFICISWHGRHNKAKLEDLKEEFRNILDYALKLSEKEALPIIIAGDFNVKIKDVEKFVPPVLVLHKYTPTKRRDSENIIDFFISSRSLIMNDMKALELKSETKVEGIFSLLDHDPVVTLLTRNQGKSSQHAQVK